MLSKSDERWRPYKDTTFSLALFVNSSVRTRLSSHRSIGGDVGNGDWDQDEFEPQPQLDAGFGCIVGGIARAFSCRATACRLLEDGWGPGVGVVGGPGYASEGMRWREQCSSLYLWYSFDLCHQVAVTAPITNHQRREGPRCQCQYGCITE